MSAAYQLLQSVVVVVLCVIGLGFGYNEEKCRNAGGFCASTSQCPGKNYISYKCPTQSSQIKCCLSLPYQESKCSSAGGTCEDETSCRRKGLRSIGGKCPRQPAGIKCCLGSTQTSQTGGKFVMTLVREVGWKTKKGKSVEGTLTYTLPDGTKRSFATLENSWLDNKKQVSCIPTGTYNPVKRFSDKGKLGRRLSVPNVPGRSLIRIHSGNKPSHTKGCILVGEPSNVADFIGNSRNTMKMLWNDIGMNTATLIVK